MTNELTASPIDDVLKNTKVIKVMSSKLLTVYEGWSVRKLSQFFLKHNISGAPVVASDDELVGVVTQSDVVRFDAKKPDEEVVAKIVEHYCGPLNRQLDAAEIDRIQDKAIDYMTVNAIMTEKVESISKEATLQEAYNLLLEKDIHRLFVVDKGILIGVITAMDILRSL
jgi:predicted transcriptional regulator